MSMAICSAVISADISADRLTDGNSHATCEVAVLPQSPPWTQGC